jgi:hypothetical protein
MPYSLTTDKRCSTPGVFNATDKSICGFSLSIGQDATSILKVLLDLDRGEISRYVIPASSFGPLAVWPGTFKQDSDLQTSFLSH